MSVTYGPLRQIWLASLSNPTDRYAFLIRDDAFSMSSANLGRTLRLGEPIDTGAISAAYQTDWSGGREQNIYSDTSMFYDGDLNSTDPQGNLKFWPGIDTLYSGPGGDAFYPIINAPLNNYPDDNKILWGRGTKLYTGGPNLGSPVTNVHTPSGSGFTITALCQIQQSEDDSTLNNVVALGLSDGRLQWKNLLDNTTADISHPTVAERGYISDIKVFGKKLAVVMNRALYTRDYTTAGGSTWVKVNYFNQANTIQSIAVYGGSIYVLCGAEGGRCQLYVTDGTPNAVSLVYEWEGHYASFGGKVIAHRGGIYIHLRETIYALNGNETLRGALYTYAGGSVRQIHTRSDVNNWLGEIIYEGTAGIWGKYVAMGFIRAPKVIETMNGTTRTTVGLMLYNPENDSFHIGPTINNLPSSTRINAICDANGSLYLGLVNDAGCTIAVMNRNYDAQDSNWPAGGDGVDTITEYPNVAQKKRKVISSAITANLPDKDKIWLRVNVKHNLKYGSGVNSTPTMNVYVKVGDDFTSTTATLIGTYTPVSGVSGYRTTSFDINVAGTRFPRSPQLQYVVELTYPTAGSCQIERAIIESVSVEYMVPPTSKSVYRFRAVCSSGQELLDGTANELTTRYALESKLTSIVQTGDPVYIWGPTIDATEPTGTLTAISAIITDFSLNSYRVDDDPFSETISEVTFTAYQVA